MSLFESSPAFPRIASVVQTICFTSLSATFIVSTFCKDGAYGHHENYLSKGKMQAIFCKDT